MPPALVASSSPARRPAPKKVSHPPASPGDVTNGLDAVANWESFIGPGTVIPTPALEEMQRAHAAWVKVVKEQTLVTKMLVL